MRIYMVAAVIFYGSKRGRPVGDSHAKKEIPTFPERFGTSVCLGRNPLGSPMGATVSHA
jgi:hypothetical protein